MEKMYTARATSAGGRDGHVKSETGVLDIDVRPPESMGGPRGEYLNPEILFAGGYAACFNSALMYMMKLDKIEGVETTVTAEVSIGKIEPTRFGLEVILDISIPGLERSVAEGLVAKAHAGCPYSNAVRGNVPVTLNLL